MNNIKIFVDCHVFDDGFQGTTTYLKGLYTELVKDHSRQFYFASCDIEYLKAVFGTQENITYLQYKSHNKFYRLLVDIPKLIKAHKINFAHFQYIVPPIKRCKYIVTTHDVLFIDYPEYFPRLNRIKNTFLFKWSARFSDIVLTVSEYSKAQIEKHFGIKNIHITSNAVAEEFFEPYDKKLVQKEIKEEYNLSNYIIYISRWEPRKKHDLILEAYVELELYKKYKLVFIGDISFENQSYNTFFNTLNPEIQENVYTFKKVSFSTMLKFLRGASISIYPSVAEGFGIPPLESLATRIPTVTSNLTAMSDFSFLSNFSFNPHKKEEFKQILLKVINTQEVDLDEPIELLKNKYSWKKSALNFNSALQQHF